MTIKPIETIWQGYRFRSRLEARWAVFFTALGWRWEYEPEGYDLGEAGRYLPDFLVPEIDGGLFVEVKPTGYQPSRHDVRRWFSLCQGTGRKLLLAAGTPAARAYGLASWDRKAEADGLRPDTVQWFAFHPGVEGGTIWRLVPVSPGAAPYPAWAKPMAAIMAARGARFEHGDAP